MQWNTVFIQDANSSGQKIPYLQKYGTPVCYDVLLKTYEEITKNEKYMKITIPNVNGPTSYWNDEEI